MRTRVIWAVLAIMVIAAAGAVADYDGQHLTVISSYGATPFVYQGYSYVPLKSAADFLGAQLLWDRGRSSATVIYRGRHFNLFVGSTHGFYMGQPVLLSAPPVLVGEQLLVPAYLFDQYFDVPVRWEPDYNRVLIMGPPGWGYYQVLPYTPSYVVTIIRGYGSPYGYGAPYYPYQPVIYQPAPFVYYGVTYIPLRDVTDFVGAALLWDDLRNRAVVTYNGREFGLEIGSAVVYYGPQVIYLPAPPVIVGGQMYVPSAFCDRALHVPFENRGSGFRIRGPRGWHDFHVAAQPPGYVYGWQRGDRDRDRDRQRVGSPTDRGPDAGRQNWPWTGTRGNTTPDRDRERDRQPVIGTQRRHDVGRQSWPWIGTGRQPAPEPNPGPQPSVGSSSRPAPESGRPSGPWMRQRERPAPQAASGAPQAKSGGPPSKQEDSKGKDKAKSGGWFKAKDKEQGND